jgi:hypothetical protein
MAGRFWRSPVVRLATHTFKHSVMFIIIAVPAVGLAALVKATERAAVSAFVVYVLTILEYAILIVDAFALLYCLVKSAWTTLRDNGS